MAQMSPVHLNFDTCETLEEIITSNYHHHHHYYYYYYYWNNFFLTHRKRFVLFPFWYHAVHSNFIDNVYYNCLLSDKSPEMYKVLFDTLIPLCRDVEIFWNDEGNNDNKSLMTSSNFLKSDKCFSSASFVCLLLIFFFVHEIPSPPPHPRTFRNFICIFF